MPPRSIEPRAGSDAPGPAPARGSEANNPDEAPETMNSKPATTVESLACIYEGWTGRAWRPGFTTTELF